MSHQNYFFSPGKLSIILDGGAGSSGKGKLGSYITEYADNWHFACNTFFPQAGHWVRLNNGKTYFYQTLNSCAYQDRYEKLYIGPGSIIELSALWREIQENNIHPSKLGIHPLVSILQTIDTEYELGLTDLDGNPTEFHNGTMKHGSTAHGCGAARARKILRKENVLVAQDIPELKPFLCDTSEEIMNRLNMGQSGLLEIAQGYQLSLNSQFFPYCTSRNCTVAAGMDDMMLPVHYAGNVMVNFRTYPIRICNYKYINEFGDHLSWDDVSKYRDEGLEVTRIEYNSGPGYDDQYELTWDEVTIKSGSDHDLTELTSVTKLPRRIFSFSKQNLVDALKYNKANGEIFISLNFANYVDYSWTGLTELPKNYQESKMMSWLHENIPTEYMSNLKLIGTGPFLNDTIRW